MNQNEVLQEYLQQIESGVPLQQILASLPEGQRELADLLILAEKARSDPHPSLPAATAASHRKRVLAAAQSRSTRRPFAGLFPVAVAAAAMFTLAVLVATAGLFYSVSTASAAQRADLATVYGIVETAPADNPNSWKIVNSGDSLHAGDHLRTRPDSSALLRFFDGSQVRLAANSQLTLTELAGSVGLISGRHLQARIRLDAGETEHEVVPLKGQNSYYEVQTPSGSASVHGTDFHVAVDAAGAARFAVSRGSVAVALAGSQVMLSAGQTTVSSVGRALLPPAYEYMLQGPITAIQANRWTVNGVSFTVQPDIATLAGYTPSEWVAVRGRVQTDGSFLADRITTAESEEPSAYFTGSVENISPDTWTISGQTVRVSGGTSISPNLKVSDRVKVPFTSPQNGSLIATAIHKLESLDDDPLPTADLTTQPGQPPVTETPETERTKTPKTEKTREPKHTETPLPTLEGTLTPEVTGTPEDARNGCSASDPINHKGEMLAERWQVNYQEIITWFCQGFGFGEIDLAYDLAKSSGKPVDELFAMKSAGQGWGEIKQAVEPQTHGPQNAVTPGANNGNNANDQNNKGGKKK